VSTASSRAASSRSIKCVVDEGKGCAHACAPQRDGCRRGQVVDMMAVETPPHLLMNHQPRIGSTSSPWSSLDADEDDGGHMQRSLRRALQGIRGVSSSGSMPEFCPCKGHH
jgi:hypothetical protein